MKKIISIIIVFLLIPQQDFFAADHSVFNQIDTNLGLSDNKVRNIAQLPDGRMLIITEGMINIYDGVMFNYLHHNEDNIMPLSDYTGFLRIYIGTDNIVWIKNQHKLMLLDINQETFLSHPSSYISSLGIKDELRK